MQDRPSLIITSQPVPESLKAKIYSKPNRMDEITPDQVTGAGYYRPVETLITRKVDELSANLRKVQGDVEAFSMNLNDLQRQNEGKAAEYYAAVATVNTQLQAGTTPGNPRLLEKLQTAGERLEEFSSVVARLNQIGVDVSQLSSENTFLLQETRAAYTLSGAVEEDHVELRKIEDGIYAMSVLIDRLLNIINDDITRTSVYLGTEKENMRTLSLAVTNGELYGKSLANRPFSNVPGFMPASAPANQNSLTASGAPAPVTPFNEPRPLVKIRFDRPDVGFEQPVYMAVNEALRLYPQARFNLVAVHPNQGNAAQTAIESTRARRNAESVLRVLTQMGLPLESIDLSYNEDPSIGVNEVHLYVQ